MIRDSPWLEPRSWPGVNCSTPMARTPRSASRHSAWLPMAPRPTTTTSADAAGVRIWTSPSALANSRPAITEQIYRSVLMSRAGTPRRRENRGGLPADAGAFLVVEAVESVWRRGLDLDG